MRGVAALLVAVTAVVLGAAMPNAHAGGNSLSPLRQRHEADDVVTFVGYTSSYFAESIEPMLAGTVEIPVQQLFRVNGPDTPATPLGIVGRPLVEATGHPAMYAYRVSIAFRLPPSTPPGEYLMRNDAGMVGDLMDGRFAVGMQPSDAFLAPELAFDDPALSVLTDDVAIRAYPRGATVGELRRGVDPGTDAWLRKPVQWPLRVIELSSDAFLPTGPTPTVPVTPTTAPVTSTPTTTAAAPTTTVPFPTETSPADDHTTTAVAAIAVAATVAFALVALVPRGYRTWRTFRNMARSTAPNSLAAAAPVEPVDHAPTADHDAEALATVS
jgi:hypothetical protein